MITIDFKTVCRFRNSTLFLFILIGATSFGQIKQSVTGIITDAVAKPLTGANIQLIRADSTFLAVSETNGKFNLSIAPGRYWIKVTFTGYSNFEDELLVIAGKSSIIKIQLNESSTQLSDVQVSSGASQEIPGSYSISIEKTMRVPANFFDPVRMATSLPGVVATNDQGNSISIKGYSPNAMLWRLNGLDVVNPNHLANAGTLSDKPVANGGGVSILSSQVLDKTKFYSGSLPVQYGNALSGAMDMSLRPGSKTLREHTVQASLIGIDLATEGPMGEKTESGEANASYLVNYRYSTVGLLSQMGVNFGDEAINFQDLTFNLDFSHKKGGNLSVFGFGGLSSNRFGRKPQDEWETEKDRYNIDFTGQVFGMGLVNTSKPSESSELKFGVSVSGQYQLRESESESVPVAHVKREYFKSNRTLISSLVSFEKAKSSKFSWNIGFLTTSINHFLNSEETFSNPAVDPNNLIGTFQATLFQPYFETNWQLRKSWSLQAGYRQVLLMRSGAGATGSMEPRLSIMKETARGIWSFNYGITSQVNQSQTYLAQGNFNGLNYAHQGSMSFNRMFGNGIRVGGQSYYHYLWGIPVSLFNNPIQYSVLNQIEDWSNTTLLPNGKGRNYGVEATVEKKFTNKTYFLVTGSWYKSEFKGQSGDFNPSRFNGNFTSSLNAGKEWNKRNKAFGIHARALYLGGLRQPVIDEVQSQVNGTTVYVDANDFAVQNPDYFRIDLRASWRKNKPGYTRTISIDIQNLTAQQNLAYRYFDTYTQKVEKKNQLGLIPVLVYRIDF